MGFLDSIMGRKKPPRADLDQLFGLPSAAITLQAGLDYAPAGVGSVAFRAPQGKAFADVQREVQELLDSDGGPAVEAEVDNFGFTWLVVRTDPADIAGLVTDLHAINVTLQDHGFGSALLCSLVVFTGPDQRRLGMVYLFKQGTFYPFAPQPGSDGSGHSGARDNLLEIQIRDLLTGELTMENQLSRWFAVWGAPGLAPQSDGADG